MNPMSPMSLYRTGIVITLEVSPPFWPFYAVCGMRGTALSPLNHLVCINTPFLLMDKSQRMALTI